MRNVTNDGEFPSVGGLYSSSSISQAITVKGDNNEWPASLSARPGQFKIVKVIALLINRDLSGLANMYYCRLENPRKENGVDSEVLLSGNMWFRSNR